MDRLLAANGLFCLAIALCAPTYGAESIRLRNLEFVPQSIPVAGNEKSLAFADLNQDGHIDLVVAHSSLDEVVVFLGSKSGELKQAGRFPAGQKPTNVTTSDIDADGHIDLVIANHETSSLTLLLGDGRGGFVAAPNSPLHVDVHPHLHVARAYDIDNDKSVDLLVDNRTGRGVLVLKGIGDGTFEQVGKLIDMGGDPYLGMVVGDINGDGLLDLITPNEDSVGIALNTDSNDMSFRLVQPVNVKSPFALELADIDADGILDLVVASDGRESSVQVLKGDGRGNFRRLGASLPISRGAKSIAVGDINADGAADVLVTSWSSDVIVILGGSDPLFSIRVTLDDIGNPWGVAIADMNGDGFGDLIIADGIRPVANVYISSSAKD